MHSYYNQNYSREEIEDILEKIKACVSIGKYSISLNDKRQENIDFINEVDSYRLIGKEFTLQYWASYKDIIPDDPLLGDALKLGKINVIYTFEDGTVFTRTDLE